LLLIRALTKGEPVAAPSGRADDFRWPRDVADTGVPDAGAKSANPAQRKSAMDAYAAQTAREQKPAQRWSRPRP
jgi:hypothetical protein